MDKLFSGVCTALVSPFKGRSVDFDAFKVLIDTQIKAGVAAVCVLGTTGEASTLSFQEKKLIVDFVINYVGDKIPVIFGIGGNNPSEIIKFGKYVKSKATKRTGVMVTAPYYNKCTQDGAVLHFNRIIEEVQLPLVVYNVPSRTGINLEPPTIARICRNPLVCGVKEASGNMQQIIEVVRLCPDTAVYCGDDAISLPCYLIGCSGLISVASNVWPRETQEIWNNRNSKEALELFMKFVPQYKVLFCEVNPIPVKYILYKMDLIRNELRLPLTGLSDKSILEYGFRELFKQSCN